jgi:hypothetical protein
MYVVVPKEFDLVTYAVDTWIHRRQHVATGSTQKERARNEGEYMGYLKGFAEVLALRLTEARAYRLPNEKMIAMVEPYDVEKFLKQAVLKHGETIGSVPKGNSDQIKKELADQEFSGWLNAEIAELIFPADMREREQERHRKAVLKGTEEARPEDAGWLQEELNRQNELADRLRGIYTQVKA